MTKLSSWIFAGLARERSSSLRIQVVSSLSWGIVLVGGRGVPGRNMGVGRRVEVQKGVEKGVEGGVMVVHFARALMRL